MTHIDNRILCFDMDGTIADLYNFPNWKYHLDHYSAIPYMEAKPLYDVDILNAVLHELKENNWKIFVISWGAMNSTQKFLEETAKAKKIWLEKYGFPYDELIVTKYGVNKTKIADKYDGTKVLIDDNEAIRKSWNGLAIPPTKDLLELLLSLILCDVANLSKAVQA